MTDTPTAATRVDDWPWLADASGQRVALTAELRARQAGPFSLAQIRAAAITLDYANRFGGRLHTVWSVARHSLLVARLARALHPEAESYGLAHDMHEAWIGDETTPAAIDFARWMGSSAYRDARTAQKSYLDSLIFPALGLQWPAPPAIHAAVSRADWLAYVVERRDFLAAGPRDARVTAIDLETANRLHPERLAPAPLGATIDRFWRALCVACPGLPPL
jgi:hypothetical protein